MIAVEIVPESNGDAMRVVGTSDVEPQEDEQKPPKVSRDEFFAMAWILLLGTMFGYGLGYMQCLMDNDLLPVELPWWAGAL